MFFSCCRSTAHAPSKISGSIAITNLSTALLNLSKSKEKSPEEQNIAKHRYYAEYQAGCLVFGFTPTVDDSIYRDLADLALIEWDTKTDQSHTAVEEYFINEFKQNKSLYQESPRTVVF